MLKVKPVILSAFLFKMKQQTCPIIFEIIASTLGLSKLSKKNFSLYHRIWVFTCFYTYAKGIFITIATFYACHKSLICA